MRWKNIERMILIATFLCTTIATIYSIRTASRALDQMSKDLRPWISVPDIDTFFYSDGLETKFQVQNIGKVPAFINIECNAEKDGRPIEVPLKSGDFSAHPNVLMPGQMVRFVALVMKGEIYQGIKKKHLKPEIYQTIRVKYGVDKETIGKYHTYLKVKFQPEKIPTSFNVGEIPGFGLWSFEESDFK